MNIDKTISIKQQVYGDYKGGSILVADMLRAINNRHTSVHGECMNLKYAAMIWDVVNKLSRIAVTPNHIDSWHDISVYAKLAEDAIRQDLKD